MFGIGVNELLLIILLMVIFIKPKDIPSVVKYISKFIKSIRSFMEKINKQLREISHEINENSDDIKESFHDRIEKLRLEFDKEPDFFDLEELNKKTPKLKIEKVKSITKQKTKSNKR